MQIYSPPVHHGLAWRGRVKKELYYIYLEQSKNIHSHRIAESLSHITSLVYRIYIRSRCTIDRTNHLHLYRAAVISAPMPPPRVRDQLKCAETIIIIVAFVCVCLLLYNTPRVAFARETMCVYIIAYQSQMRLAIILGIILYC